MTHIWPGEAGEVQAQARFLRSSQTGLEARTESCFARRGQIRRWQRSPAAGPVCLCKDPALAALEAPAARGWHASLEAQTRAGCQMPGIFCQLRGLRAVTRAGRAPARPRAARPWPAGHSALMPGCGHGHKPASPLITPRLCRSRDDADANAPNNACSVGICSSGFEPGSTASGRPPSRDARCSWCSWLSLWS